MRAFTLSSRTTLILFGLIVCLCLGSQEKSQAVVTDGNDEYQKQIVPLFVKYCQSCHGGNKPKASLSLEKYKTAADFGHKPELLDSMATILRSGDMPPEGKPKPTPAENERLIAWLEQQFKSAAATGKRDPGRVTMRRLNRNEYNNTIRDLTGVEFKPAEDFPADDVGYGFDNIGDVLSLPPLLMEKYLTAAERIVDQALLPKPNPNAATKRRWQGREMQPRKPEHLIGPNKSHRLLITNSEIKVTFDFPRDGEYEFTVLAYGQQAGGELPKLSLKLDRQNLRVFEVKAVEAKAGPHKHKMRVKAGSHEIFVGFTNDYYDENNKDPKQRDRNLINVGVEDEGPLNLPVVEMKHPILIARPGDQLSVPEAARKILTHFAQRAYRRPVTTSEINKLMSLFERSKKRYPKFEEALEVPLQAVLVSPHFLFRVELDTSREAVRELNDYELASRLSYFLWSTMPDEKLFETARRGDLKKPEVLASQVKRMLLDAKSQTMTENFANQWLQLRNLKQSTPDPKRFPQFDEPLRAAMIKETELFFQEMLQQNQPLGAFLDANFTFVNERLAKHYGIPGIYGPEFRKVSLSGTQRRGILTQGSILTLTSNPTRTSPVKRGKWVLETILGTPPPPPVPDAGDLKEGEELKGTLRQRMEQHRANPNCATCHQRMDPIGFGFENFDAVGAWRTKDGKFPIEPGGTLPSGQSFQTPVELVAILKQRHEEFRRCLTEKMLTFALGRGLELGDKPFINDIAQATLKHGDTMTILIQEIVKSDPFRYRRLAPGG